MITIFVFYISHLMKYDRTHIFTNINNIFDKQLKIFINHNNLSKIYKNIIQLSGSKKYN